MYSATGIEWHFETFLFQHSDRKGLAHYTSSEGRGYVRLGVVGGGWCGADL